MKTRIITLSLSLFALIQFANATVRTVSNYYNTPGQYTDLPAAVTASSNGDTIYLHPSNTQYTGVILTKQLTIFGAGYDARSYQFTNLITNVNYIYLSKNGTLSTSTGTKLAGLRIGSISVQSDTIFNVTIERCYINGSLYTSYGGYNLNAATNWIIRNCFISGSMNATSRNNLITNNFLSTSSSQGTNVFTNNDYLGYYYSTPLGTMVNTIFTNNIIDNFNPTAQAITNGNQTGNTISNNITYNMTGALPGTGNTGSNNHNNTAIGFTAPFSTWPNYFDTIPNYNWKLTNGSIGHLAGTDTTDIGVYGGVYPPNNLEGVTQLPQVIQMNIPNPSVPLNGTLNVNVTGIKRD